MKKSSQVLAAFAVMAAIVSFTSTKSFADRDDWHHHDGDDWHHHHHDDGDPNAAIGFLAGLEAALLTTISANANDYDAQTLEVQAAAYEDTREKGAVFEAFASQVAQQMGARAKQVSPDRLDDMIAQRILAGDLN